MITPDDIINTICEDRTPAEILRMIHPHDYSITDKYVVFIDNKLVSFTMAYEGKSIIDYERLVSFYVDEKINKPFLFWFTRRNPGFLFYFFQIFVIL